MADALNIGHSISGSWEVGLLLWLKAHNYRFESCPDHN
jgi:hypothetical protein